MRRLRYVVAASLDGYIAGPEGEADWIVMDPEIDFDALFVQFDTLLMGRKTYEAMIRMGGDVSAGKKVVVVSRTLEPREHPALTVLSRDVGETIAAMRREPGKDIWLFGGGELFRSLLEPGLVDSVEVALIPVLLGGGIPLLPAPASKTKLELARHRVYPSSGIVSLEYAVEGRSPGG